MESKTEGLLKLFKSIQNAALSFSSLATGLFVGILFTSLIAGVGFYVHETGHILGCHLAGLLSGSQVSCNFSNWVKVPLYPGIIELPAPQQTTSSVDVGLSSLVYFGGPLLAMVFFASIGIIVQNRLKIRNVVYWIIPAAFVSYELFGNILCGTDNLTNAPLGFCENVIAKLVLQWGLSLSVFTITYLLYPYIRQKFELITIRNPMKRKGRG
jgi:hypothetical protein